MLRFTPTTAATASTLFPSALPRRILARLDIPALVDLLLASDSSRLLSASPMSSLVAFAISTTSATILAEVESLV